MCRTLAHNLPQHRHHCYSWEYCYCRRELVERQNVPQLDYENKQWRYMQGFQVLLVTVCSFSPSLHELTYTPTSHLPGSWIAFEGTFSKGSYSPGAGHSELQWSCAGSIPPHRLPSSTSSPLEAGLGWCGRLQHSTN